MLAWYWSLGIVSVLWNYFAVFEHSVSVNAICFCVDLLQVLDAHLELPLVPLASVLSPHPITPGVWVCLKWFID